jgi:hypothetical protein
VAPQLRQARWRMSRSKARVAHECDPTPACCPACQKEGVPGEQGATADDNEDGHERGPVSGIPQMRVSPDRQLIAFNRTVVQEVTSG